MEHDQPKLRLAAAFDTANRAQMLRDLAPRSDGNPTPRLQADAQSPECGELNPGLTGRNFTCGTAQNIVANLGVYPDFVERVAHCANDEQIRMGVNQLHTINVADRN